MYQVKMKWRKEAYWLDFQFKFAKRGWALSGINHDVQSSSRTERCFSCDTLDRQQVKWGRMYRQQRVWFRAEVAYSSTDLVILSVQDMVMSCSPCKTPSHVWTGPRHRTGTVPSPDSILVRRWLRCFLMRCLLLCTANTTHTITAWAAFLIIARYRCSV